MLEYWLAMGIVIVAFIYDITSFRIPNWLCLTTLGLGLCVGMFEAGWIGLLQAIIAMLIAFIPMSVIYLLKGIGAGDVKLFATIATLVGIHAIIELMILSFLFGGVVSVLLLGYQTIKKIKQKLKFVYSPYVVELPSGETLSRFGIMKVHQFPFMIAVAPAMIVLFLIK